MSAVAPPTTLSAAPQRKRLVWSIREELLQKAREAAITAVKVFNDPAVMFKSETFIVLMIIAWTYLLHAYYRSEGIDYRYYDQGKKRKRYHRTKNGSYKFWELERCLNDDKCPIDPEARQNLRFLIGLRHAIEHQMSYGLDAVASSRYQACAVNINDYLKRLFGRPYGFDEQMAYAIQFLHLSEDQVDGPTPEPEIPPRLRAYIAEFDGGLKGDEYNSPRYAYRMIFVRKLVNHPSQADRVVEFIPASSPLAENISKEYWVKREVERVKYRPTDVVAKVKAAGFPRFRVTPEHSAMWRAEGAKDPGKNYGVEIAGTWYWYENWVSRCIELCAADPDRYALKSASS